MIDLSNVANNLRKENGIYFAKSSPKVSYPSQGNEHCFQIEENSFWFKHRNDCITNIVKQSLDKEDVFYDVGGGNGYVAKGLEDCGIKTVLVEPGIEGALNAQKRNLQHIICSTMEDASFKLNSLDAVGLFDVVEHIEDDALFLKSISNFLKPKGKIFITVPAYNWLWSSEDEYAGHYRRYTLQSMERVLLKNNMKISYSSYLFSILPVPVFFFRRLPKILGIKTNPDSSENHKSDHSAKMGVIERILRLVWNWELKMIKKRNKVPFGGSCLVVAEKL